jgi:hypothetical protein
MFFIDESGIIPKTYPSRRKFKYFVISYVHTNNHKRLKRVYRRSLKKLKSSFPDFFDSLENPKEPKGSELHPFMKYHIVHDLLTYTDIKLGHMVVDNQKIEQRFREDASRSFNYLTKIIISNFPLTVADKKHLSLNIDNRNVAVKNLKELKGYLEAELILNENLVDKVSVQYFDSKYTTNIQVADLFANIFYQRFRYKDYNFPLYKNLMESDNLVHPYSIEYIYQYILDSGRLVIPFMYPPSEAAQVAATVQL